MNIAKQRRGSRNAFTLVELLTVVAIMAVIAGLVVGLVGVAGKAKRKSRAQAELNELVTAIDAYFAKFNQYPQSGADELVHPLYLELTGTIFNPATGTFSTRDNRFTYTQADLQAMFGASFAGLANAEDGAAGQNYLSSLKPERLGLVKFGNPAAQTLQIIKVAAEAQGIANEYNVASGDYWRGIKGWDASSYPSYPTPPSPFYGQDEDGNGFSFNGWRYNSVNPARNPNSYDLWAEIQVGDETITIGNWDN